MAQQFYKIDLDNPEVFLREKYQTRTVIGASLGKAPADSDRVGISYINNVLPTSKGYASVGYKSATEDEALAEEADEVRGILNIDSDHGLLLLIDSGVGDIYSRSQVSGAWNILPTPSALSGHTTDGTVDGKTYLYKNRILDAPGGAAFAYLVNATFDGTTTVTLAGLDPDTLQGVLASNGYLIAYTSDSVAWSSTISPIDFVPSAVTGAGGGTVPGLAGGILGVYPIADGFIVYTANNAISAVYTGNPSFPFKFTEIAGYTGPIGLLPTTIAKGSAYHTHFVITPEGIQAVKVAKAELILPEISEFLTGGLADVYDPATGTMSEVAITAGLQNSRLRLVASRYLVVSYSVNSLTTTYSHCLVYDMLLNKIGKLEIAHQECMAIDYSGYPVAIGFLTADCRMVRCIVEDGAYPTVTDGTIILGKLQTSYSRMFKLLEVEVENVKDAATFDCRSRPSLDGKTMATTGEVAGTLATTAEPLRAYKFYSTAKNHSLVFTGAFNLTTALVTFASAGKR